MFIRGLLHSYRMMERMRNLSKATGCRPSLLRRYTKEALRDEMFIGDIVERHKDYTSIVISAEKIKYWPNPLIAYAFVRHVKPSIVVETGGTPGRSSAFILCAMNKNGKGELYTIDKPPPEGTVMGETRVCQAVPKGMTAGWLIPNYLRDKHNLIIGDSKKELPKLLRKLGRIDVFIHDSLHTYDHMLFEYKTAWPHVKKGGYLLSDDVRTGVGAVFSEFLKMTGTKGYIVSNYGITRKAG